jgi:integrase
MKDPGDFIERDQARRLLDVCTKPRDKLLLSVYITTGRRVSEGLLLKPKHINYNEKAILWKILKGRKDKHLWILANKKLLNMLKEYIEFNKIDSDSYVFESSHRPGKPITRFRVNQIVKKWCELAGIVTFGGRPVHPHTFRHSFCVWSARRLKSPKHVMVLKELMGHANVQTTYSYLHVTQREVKELVSSYDDLLAFGDDEIDDEELKEESADFTDVGIPF